MPKPTPAIRARGTNPATSTPTTLQFAYLAQPENASPEAQVMMTNMKTIMSKLDDMHALLLRHDLILSKSNPVKANQKVSDKGLSDIGEDEEEDDEESEISLQTLLAQYRELLQAHYVEYIQTTGRKPYKRLGTKGLAKDAPDWIAALKTSDDPDIELLKPDVANLRDTQQEGLYATMGKWFLEERQKAEALDKEVEGHVEPTGPSKDKSQRAEKATSKSLVNIGSEEDSSVRQVSKGKAKGKKPAGKAATMSAGKSNPQPKVKAKGDDNANGKQSAVLNQKRHTIVIDGSDEAEPSSRQKRRKSIGEDSADEEQSVPQVKRRKFVIEDSDEDSDE